MGMEDCLRGFCTLRTITQNSGGNSGLVRKRLAIVRVNRGECRSGRYFGSALKKRHPQSSSRTFSSANTPEFCRLVNPMKFPELTDLRANSLLIVIALAMLATVIYLPSHPFVDEYIHWPTAQLFAQGKWPLNPGISTWPTMNAVVGWTTSLFGQSRHITAGRLVIAVFGFIAIAGFYQLAQEFDTASAKLRTAQFFLSPIVLPFCALIYTDLPALSCLLWSAVGAMRRQPWLLIGAGALACAFRQNEIVWFGAFAILFGWLSLRDGDRIKLLPAIAIVAVIAIWLVLVKLQGGVAAGAYTQGDHPGGLKGIPNIWFALVVATIVYLPYFVFRLFTDAQRLPLWQFLALGLLVAFTFEVKHRFNLIEFNYFVRNNLLHQTFTQQGMGIFLVVATISAVLAFRTRLTAYENLRLPLLVFSVLSLLPFWLIEQRYDLPIFALFWAARTAIDRRVEIAQLLFGSACSLWMIVHIAHGTAFV